MSWKLEVLNTLKDAGVWLEDASVVGVYRPGKHVNLRKSVYEGVLRESCTRFVLPSIDHQQPPRVWVVGQGVANALARPAFD